MDDLLQTTVKAEEVRRHSNASIDMKLEVIVIPVSHVDHAKVAFRFLVRGQLHCMAPRRCPAIGIVRYSGLPGPHG